MVAQNYKNWLSLFGFNADKVVICQDYDYTIIQFYNNDKMIYSMTEYADGIGIWEIEKNPCNRLRDQTSYVWLDVDMEEVVYKEIN